MLQSGFRSLATAAGAPFLASAKAVACILPLMVECAKFGCKDEMEALRLCIPTWLEFRSYFRTQIRPITPSSQVSEVGVQFISKLLACWGFCNSISIRLPAASRKSNLF